MVHDFACTVWINPTHDEEVVAKDLQNIFTYLGLMSSFGLIVPFHSMSPIQFEICSVGHLLDVMRDFPQKDLDGMVSWYSL